MGVVNTNISSLIGLNNMRQVNMGLKTSLERLSSGIRINKGADDPSGLAIAKGMEAQIGGIRMAVHNAEDGINLIHTADGALAETHDILMRMRDLAVRAANEAVLTTADNRRLNEEFQSLKDELERKSKAVTFNTKVLFSGAFCGTPPSDNVGFSVGGMMLQIGPDNGSVYQVTVNIPELGLSGLGLQATTTSVTANGNQTNWYVGIDTKLSTPEVALSALDAVQRAIDKVSDTRNYLGIQERRLDHIIDDLKYEDINISAAKSRIWDADMASEISEFTRLQILQQSGTAILAQANAQPQSVLQLLQ